MKIWMRRKLGHGTSTKTGLKILFIIYLKNYKTFFLTDKIAL